MPPSTHKEHITKGTGGDTPPTQAGGGVCMSLEMTIDVVLCGAFLVGLGFLAYQLQPDFSCVTLLTGLVGGGLCVLCGVLGRRGTPCRAGGMMILAAAACVFARQAVLSWKASAGGESYSGMVMPLMVVSVVFCVGTLGNLAQEGKGVKP